MNQGAAGASDEDVDDENLERSESDWGMTPPKRKMRREAKLILLAIPLLLAGMGYAVYWNMQRGGFVKDIVDEAEREIVELEKKVGEKVFKKVPETVDPDEEPEPRLEDSVASDDTDPFGGSEPESGDDAMAKRPQPVPERVSLAAMKEEDRLDNAGEDFKPDGGDGAFESIPARRELAQERKLEQKLEREVERLEELANEEAQQSLDAKPLAEAVIVEIEEREKLEGHRRVEEFSAQAKSETQVVITDKTIVVEKETPRKSVTAEIVELAKDIEQDAAQLVEDVKKHSQHNHPTPAPAHHADPRLAGFRREEIGTDQARSSTQVERRADGHRNHPEHGAQAPHRVAGSGPASIDGGEFDSDRQHRNSPKPARAEAFGSSRVHGDPRRRGETAVKPLDFAEGEKHSGHVDGAETYVVQSGDNFWTISRKVYGTGRYFQALAQHNHVQAPDTTHMQPGMKVKIPPRELLERHYPELFKNSSSGQLVSYRTSGGMVKDSHGDPGFFLTDRHEPMYRVGAEDTLTGIAKQCLGRSSRWTDIFALNRETLSSPDNLKIGTVLRLPPDADVNRVAGDPAENR